MADGVLAHNVLALAAHNDAGPVPQRGRGSHTVGLARYGLYRTSDDRYVAVAAQEKPFWDNLCEAIGRPDLKAYHAASGEPGAEARRVLEQIFAGRPLAHWNELLASHDLRVPCPDFRGGVGEQAVRDARYDRSTPRRASIRFVFQAVGVQISSLAFGPKAGLEHLRDLERTRY